MRAVARTRVRWLGMGAPPLDQSCRHHRKCEINKRKDPQPAPVTRHLPEARAQLVDAHDAVDREIRGKDRPEVLHRLGYSLPRPRKAGPEEPRPTGAQKDKRRRFRPPAPTPPPP